jgi:ferric-dicitrate binding protein FerR (iron transport regulator)
MAGEASPQELKELEDVLKNNPELHFSLQALSDLWKESPNADDSDIESAYLSHLNRMKSQGTEIPGINEEDFVENSSLFSSQKQSSFKRRILVGTSLLAAAAILITISFFLFAPSGSSKNGIKPVASEISTRYGSKTTSIVLSDGSKVWLNAGSKLTYDKDFGETLRGVSLSGEAYFDVVHNGQKPFVIHTTAMDIKVLGTEFNVKSYPEESTTEASLIRGSIEVTLKNRRAEKIYLKPNEKLVVKNEKIIGPPQPFTRKTLKQSTPIFSLSPLNYSSLDSTILETSWVNNRLLFEDESFTEVATRMSRWYGVDFIFKDEEIQKLRFTGNIKDETVIEALKAMQITADFAFRVTDTHITITKN